MSRYFVCCGCDTDYIEGGCKLEVVECTAPPDTCPWESVDVNWKEISKEEFEILDVEDIEDN